MLNLSLISDSLKQNYLSVIRKITDNRKQDSKNKYNNELSKRWLFTSDQILSCLIDKYLEFTQISISIFIYKYLYQVSLLLEVRGSVLVTCGSCIQHHAQLLAPNYHSGISQTSPQQLYKKQCFSHNKVKLLICSKIIAKDIKYRLYRLYNLEIPLNIEKHKERKSIYFLIAHIMNMKSLYIQI